MVFTDDLSLRDLTYEESIEAANHPDLQQIQKLIMEFLKK